MLWSPVAAVADASPTDSNASLAAQVAEEGERCRDLEPGGEPEHGGERADELAIDRTRQVLWSDRQLGHAFFIPEQVFRDQPIDKLPLPQEHRDLLASSLESMRRPHPNPYVARLPQKPCEPLYAPAAPGSHPEATTIAQLLATAPLAVMGQVAEVVPGYTPSGLDVAEVAYVRVDRVLKSPRPLAGEAEIAVKAGDDLAILFRGGSMEMYGEIFCRERREGFYQPVPGSWIVVTGELYEPDPRLIIHDFVFPIEGNEVLPQPYAYLRRDAGSLPLSELTREPIQEVP